MKILITGASGMLGGEVKRELIKKVGPELLFSPNRSELDLLDFQSTFEYLESNNIDCIIHCAARVGGIHANVSQPFEFLNSNVRMDANLIKAASDLRIDKFLYIASSCMYPRNAEQPFKENQILTGLPEPTNEGYALAKIVGTKSVSLVGQDLNWRTLVLSNIYGPGDNYDASRSHLLAAIIFKFAEAKRLNANFVEMWGSGEAKREFTYVTDVAKYVSEIVFNLGTLPLVMNIGNGKQYSVKEYYEIVKKEFHFDGEIIPVHQKYEGMSQKLMDSSKARGYNWNPTTEIYEGVKKSILDYNTRFKR